MKAGEIFLIVAGLFLLIFGLKQMSQSSLYEIIPNDFTNTNNVNKFSNFFYDFIVVIPLSGLVLIILGFVFAYLRRLNLK